MSQKRRAFDQMSKSANARGKRSAARRLVLENLEDRIDVGGRAKVETEIVTDCRVHDSASRSLHRVVQAGVNNVLFRSSGHPSIEFG